MGNCAVQIRPASSEQQEKRPEGSPIPQSLREQIWGSRNGQHRPLSRDLGLLPCLGGHHRPERCTAPPEQRDKWP